MPVPKTDPEREAEEERTLGIALLAVFFLVLVGVWNGIGTDILWVIALVVVLIAGLVLVKSGLHGGDVMVPTLGSALVLAVIVPFVSHFLDGTADPGGPWVPIAAAITGPVVVWHRLALLERTLALTGTAGILAFLLRPVEATLDLTTLTVAALILMVTLALAANRAEPED